MEDTIAFVDEPNDVLVDRRTKVWLECNGVPHDIRSISVTGVRTIAEGVELVVFACPRCGKRHQSLRFA
jgi:hypothetical protein